MRVLYVDDDRINTLLFIETCRMARGVQVQSADSGAQALQLAPSWRPDLLVIDLHLPDTCGYDLLPALRAVLAQPELEAYLCTADDAPLVEQPAREAGFTGCWTKPVDLRRMLSHVSRYNRGASAT
jgi:two-component system OmpR family response regulator